MVSFDLTLSKLNNILHWHKLEEVFVRKFKSDVADKNLW